MRLLSLSPSTTELLIALGVTIEQKPDEDSGLTQADFERAMHGRAAHGLHITKWHQLVGVDRESMFPEEVQELPHIDFQNFSAVTMEELNVDLVFLDASATDQVRSIIDSCEISMIEQNPDSLHQFYEDIRSLGLMLQLEDEARGLCLQMQQGFNEVKRKGGLLPRKFMIHFQEISAPWLDEICSFAGARLTGNRDEADLIVVPEKREGDERFRIVDRELLEVAGPRLVEGCQRLFGWGFERLH